MRVVSSFSLALTLQSSLFHCFVHQLVRVAFCLELILEVDLLAAIYNALYFTAFTNIVD